MVARRPAVGESEVVKMKRTYQLEEHKGEVVVTLDGSSLTMERNGQTTTYQVFRRDGEVTLTLEGRVVTSSPVSRSGDHSEVWVRGRSVRLSVSDPKKFGGGRSGKTGASSKEIRAFMPGRVSLLHIKEGDLVQEGDPILVLEAMKMENELKAPRAAKISKIHVEVGASVEMSALLISLEPLTEEAHA